MCVFNTPAKIHVMQTNTIHPSIPFPNRAAERARIIKQKIFPGLLFLLLVITSVCVAAGITILVYLAVML